MPKTLSIPTGGTVASPTICTGCVHDGNCTFQSNSISPILLCEEREEERTLEPTHLMKAIKTVVPSVPGICGSCIHAEHCALRDPERITYHCEHYE